MITLKKILVAAVLPLTLFTMNAPLASAEEMTPGETEVLVFAGGLTDYLGATFGAGLQYAVRPRWLFSGELGYLTVEGPNNGMTVDLNAHYLFPLADQERFTPYVLGGLGIARVSGNGFSDTRGGLNLGGGARWAISDNWGVRPELKFFVGNNSFTRFTVGLFYSLSR